MILSNGEKEVYNLIYRCGRKGILRKDLLRQIKFASTSTTICKCIDTLIENQYVEKSTEEHTIKVFQIFEDQKKLQKRWMIRYIAAPRKELPQ